MVIALSKLKLLGKELGFAGGGSVADADYIMDKSGEDTLNNTK
jgi:hypothetical protein